MTVLSLIYISKHKEIPGNDNYITDLRAILKSAKRNNKANNVTGALLFDDAYFVEALEGDEVDVEATFDRVCRDKRHVVVKTVRKATLPARLFGNWWMAGLLKSGKTVSLFEPYRRQGQFDPLNMTADEILSLMRALAEGGLDRRLGDEAPADPALRQNIA